MAPPKKDSNEAAKDWLVAKVDPTLAKRYKHPVGPALAIGGLTVLVVIVMFFQLQATCAEIIGALNPRSSFRKLKASQHFYRKGSGTHTAWPGCWSTLDVHGLPRCFSSVAPPLWESGADQLLGFSVALLLGCFVARFGGLRASFFFA